MLQDNNNLSVKARKGTTINRGKEIRQNKS